MHEHDESVGVVAVAVQLLCRMVLVLVLCCFAGISVPGPQWPQHNTSMKQFAGLSVPWLQRLFHSAPCLQQGQHTSFNSAAES